MGNIMNEWEEVQDLIANYKPPAEAHELLSRMAAVFMVGITGAGKDAMAHGIMEKHPDQYVWLVSYVTRHPRMENGQMERDGDKYHFVDNARILAMLQNHEFVEAEIVHQEVRATALADLQAVNEAGKIAIKTVDIQGAGELCEMSDNIRAIFILPPSYEVWYARFENRYGLAGDDTADVKKRLESAVMELDTALSSDFLSFMINDDLDEAVALADRIARGEVSTHDDPAPRAVARELLERITERLES